MCPKPRKKLEPARRRKKVAPKLREPEPPKWAVESLRDVARFFSKSWDHVRKVWVAGGMPGTVGAYDLQEIYRWREARWEEESRKRPNTPEQPAQPTAIEQLREQQAALARLKLLEHQNSLLPRDQVHDGLSRIATIIRSAGQALERIYGAEARRIIDDALDQAEEEIRALGGTEPASDRISATPNLIPRPTTIARPGSVPNSTPRTPSRAFIRGLRDIRPCIVTGP